MEEDFWPTDQARVWSGVVSVAITILGERLVQGHSYQVKSVLGQYNAWKKTVLSSKDSPGNTLGRSLLLPRLAGKIMGRENDVDHAWAVLSRTHSPLLLL